MASTRWRIVLSAAVLFALAVVTAGNGGVLPQLFYQRYYPQQKVLLLATSLLAATCGSLTGVAISRRLQLRKGATLAVLVATLGAESGLFLIHSARLYILLNTLAQLGANLLTNALDHRAVVRAGPGSRQLYDACSNAARLLGMLAAPVFFTVYYDRRVVVYVTLAGLLLLAAVSSSSLFTGVSSLPGEAGPAEPGPLAAAEKSLETTDRLLVTYAIIIYTTLYLLAANLLYLLRDVLHLAEAERRGGQALVVVSAAALVANVAAAALPRATGRSGRARRLLALAAPAVSLSILAVLFLAGVPMAYFSILLGCLVIGSAYGGFLFAVRDYMSSSAREQGKLRLLTFYNNLANLSQLLAFSMMAGLAGFTFWRHSSQATVYPLLIGLLLGLPLLGLPLLPAALIRRRPIH